MVETIQWTDGGVVMIDQTRLPREEVFVTCTDYEQVAEAIRSMIIRGAPAIGVAAAMGVAIGALKADDLHGKLRNDLLDTGRYATDGGESLLGDRPNEESVRSSKGSAD